MNKSICLVVLLALFGCNLQTTAKKKSKGKSLASLTVKKDSVNADYKKVIKDGTIVRGLFTTITNKKEGKLYFELSDSAFQHIYLLANRVAATSNTQDFVAGQMATQPLMIRFSHDDQKVYMHEVQQRSVVNANDPIAAAFNKNFRDPVLKGFKIVAKNNGNLVIDMTSFFAGNEKCISPIKQENPLSKLVGGKSALKGSFVPEASNLMEVKTFQNNIEVESLLSFNLTLLNQPYSVTMHRSLFVLPDVPMQMRLQDNRVGFFYLDRSIYSSDADRIDTRTYIHRWRLEPREEDRARYFAGELVEPMKPIVFYVDTAFPEKWRGTIKAGIEDWNVAFEKAGFKHAIRAVDYPKDNPDFDPDDMRYSCFKYAATATPNAMGPSYVDPRTGEILTGDVIWYHNIISLLHNWRFVQTGAVDERVRKTVFDDDVMRESIRYAAAHEIGHTLGLMHNMGASYSFPVDSLRSPSFTQKYGTTPSIMDYARNNYVAQPGDMERGVKLTPPLLGVYDINAIHWGYRLIPDVNTPEDEKPVLDAWIQEKAGDPMYEFGAQQFMGTVDPTDLTEDLGDDHIKAGDYGISNLKILMAHLEEWMMEEGERYDAVENMYQEVVNQYSRYLRHVMPYIGGIRYEEIRQGDGKSTSKHYIDKATQKKAMAWLLAQARSYNDWLTPSDLIGKLEINMNVNDKLQSSIVSSLLNSAVLYRIQEGSMVDAKNGYRLADYLNDVTAGIFKAPVGGKLELSEQGFQAAAIALMMNTSGLNTVAKSASSFNATEELEGMTGDEKGCCHPICSGAAREEEYSFLRINFGLPTLGKTQMGALMTGTLRKVLQLYKSRRASATGDTRDFYDYQILLMEKTLSNK